MRKIAIILAGAAAFDLGVVVVSSHAAVDMFLKVQGASAEKAAPVAPAFHKHKIDLINTVKACKAGGGRVVKVDGTDQCHTTRAPLPGGPRAK